MTTIPWNPFHRHDCERCIYLGTVRYEGSVYDLYRCPQAGVPSLIARCGSLGPDYISAPEEMVARGSVESELLQIAHVLAASDPGVRT